MDVRRALGAATLALLLAPTDARPALPGPAPPQTALSGPDLLSGAYSLRADIRHKVFGIDCDFGDVTGTLGEGKLDIGLSVLGFLSYRIEGSYGLGDGSVRLHDGFASAMRDAVRKSDYAKVGASTGSFDGCSATLERVSPRRPLARVSVEFVDYSCLPDGRYATSWKIVMDGKEYCATADLAPIAGR